MTEYDYSISGDFPNGINSECLHRIINEYGFPITFLGVNVTNKDDNVSIVFDEDLSSSDKDDLDTLISTYNPNNDCSQEETINLGRSKVNFSLHDNSVDYISSRELDWAVGSTFIFEGTSIWTPNKFSIISSMQSSGNTGSARLFDQTNNNEICLIEWTDEEKILSSTQSLTNLPTYEAIFELQLKTNNKSSEARIYNMSLY